MATNQDVADMAREAAEYGGRELERYFPKPRGETFHLQEPGPARFIRQVHEAVLGLRPGEWEFADQTDSAVIMAVALECRADQVTVPLPGDIMVWAEADGPGLGIYLGWATLAASTAQGPGVRAWKLTDLDNVQIRYYRVLPAPEEADVSPWAREAFTWCQNVGLMTDQNLRRPHSPLTYEEAAVFAYGLWMFLTAE